MRTSCVKNGLVMVVILLFIGVALSPVITAVDNDTDDDVSIDSVGLGFIMCITSEEWWVSPNRVMLLPVFFVLVSCTDLDTGEVRYGFTIFCFHIFKFLKRGHNYKISSVPYNFNADDVYIDNLNSFEIVDLVHKRPPP